MAKKVITSLKGQWEYPGEVTKVPSNKITMKGVNYPVLGIDDLGHEILMLPNQDYTFPGKEVTEYPIMRNGGSWLDKYQSGGDISPDKAEYLLNKGYVYGRPLTDNQILYFKSIVDRANRGNFNQEEYDYAQTTGDYYSPDMEDYEVLDYRRGGHVTDKNIKSAINYLFTRNRDLFGSRRREYYAPKGSKFNGWLNKYE